MWAHQSVTLGPTAQPVVEQVRYDCASWDDQLPSWKVSVPMFNTLEPLLPICQAVADCVCGEGRGGDAREWGAHERGEREIER